MAAKKYLSLEEAAQVLGLRSDEVIRLRERGDLRGFADRGTWKFKSDDVEEAKRRRQPDSNPDVPIIDEESSVLDDDEQLGAQATMVRRGGPGSDSDVRLILGDDFKSKPLAGSSAEIPILKGPKSDSDVRLVGSPSTISPPMGSDSDVKLLKPKASDSKIRLSDSDSDVRLSSPGKGSDSDVKLVASPAAGPDDLPFDFDSDSVLLDDDSGMPLGGDSGVKLTGGSSLRLTADSGIRLSQPADSGILLEGPADSGIKLQTPGASGMGLGLSSGLGLAGGRSGPKLAGSKGTDDLDVTAPMRLGNRPDMAGTDPEVPLMDLDEDEELDLMPKGRGTDDTHAETSVIMFDDEDEELDDSGATMKRKKPAGLSGVGFDDSAEIDATAEFEDDEELEVSDEILGEDDELEEMEVFDTEDTDFGDFEDGASSPDFQPRGAGKMVAAEPEWSGGTVALVACSAIFLVIGTMVGVDLLSTVFNGGGPMNPSLFMTNLGGLFQ
ncbi:MAG TPA: helix-turn-helix domain-containing protein [Planctomycetaceae bacterium]|nr:helix-turn-helix domain-containing protein [Planctomycetaceae bacterium]